MTGLPEKTEKLKPYLVRLRRELHACAELGLCEYKTSAVVQRELKKLGLPFKVTANTGVVALLKGARPGKIIAVRADMDALPVTEETGLAFASKKRGVAHSCGHDAHMTCALGLAKLFKENQKALKGSVKFIFQPSEEMGEVNLDGAKKMIEAGAMKNPVPSAVIGLHVSTPLKTGSIELTYGKVYANADLFEVTVKGVGGHASAPEKTVDPIVAAAAIVLNLQSIVARNVSPLESAVISVSLIRGGETSNVIPPKVRLLGTVRTLENKTKGLIKRRMRQVIRSTAKAYRAAADFKYTDGYPSFSNNKKMAKLIERAGIKLLGKDKVHIAVRPSMGGENFGNFAKLAPAAFFNLGANSGKKQTAYSLHHPKFDIDEAALPVGTAILARACLDFLNG